MLYKTADIASSLCACNNTDEAPMTANQTAKKSVTAINSLQGSPLQTLQNLQKAWNILWKFAETKATLPQARHTNVIKETELLYYPQDINYTGWQQENKREMHIFSMTT